MYCVLALLAGVHISYVSFYMELWQSATNIRGAFVVVFLHTFLAQLNIPQLLIPELPTTGHTTGHTKGGMTSMPNFYVVL